MLMYKNMTSGLIAAMTGQKSELTSLAKKGEDLQITHFIIHREMLAKNHLSPGLHDVLASVWTCLIQDYLQFEEMRSTYKKLLYHTDVLEDKF